MTAIDVGPAAIDRPLSQTFGNTLIALDNPANDTGTITTVEIWAATNIGGCKVGTFSGSGTSYTSRDFETIGNVTAGSKQSFSGLNIDVVTGDVIGNYFTSGSIELSGTGGGFLYVAGDKFDGSPYSYNLLSGYAFSEYGIGSTDTGGWANIAKVSGVESANIAKVSGVAVSNIAKVSGVAV